MRIINEGSTMTLERHVLQAVINKAVIHPNVWNVYLIVAPEIANANRDMLLELGFLYSGNLSRGNKTFLRCKRHIRTSGEAGGSNLAVAQPMLGPSADEQKAIDALLKSPSLAPLSPQRLRELKKMGKKKATKEPEDAVITKMRADIARLESQQEG